MSLVAVCQLALAVGEVESNRAAAAAELKAAVIQLEIVETDFLIRQCTTPRAL